MSEQWTPYRAFQAEGARVALCTCLTCGAAVFVDPTDTIDAVSLHEQWHQEIDR